MIDKDNVSTINDSKDSEICMNIYINAVIECTEYRIQENVHCLTLT